MDFSHIYPIINYFIFITKNFPLFQVKFIAKGSYENISLDLKKIIFYRLVFYINLVLHNSFKS